MDVSHIKTPVRRKARILVIIGGFFGIGLSLAACVQPHATGVLGITNSGTKNESANAAKQSVRVDINHADARQLEQLPGIGGVLAAQIIEHRTRYGRFRRPEDLILVHRMSEKRYLALQSLIIAQQ